MLPVTIRSGPGPEDPILGAARSTNWRTIAHQFLLTATNRTVFIHETRPDGATEVRSLAIVETTQAPYTQTVPDAPTVAPPARLTTNPPPRVTPQPQPAGNPGFDPYAPPRPAPRPQIVRGATPATQEPNPQLEISIAAPPPHPTLIPLQGQPYMEHVAQDEIMVRQDLQTAGSLLRCLKRRDQFTFEEYLPDGRGGQTLVTYTGTVAHPYGEVVRSPYYNAFIRLLGLATGQG